MLGPGLGIKKNESTALGIKCGWKAKRITHLKYNGPVHVMLQLPSILAFCWWAKMAQLYLHTAHLDQGGGGGGGGLNDYVLASASIYTQGTANAILTICYII